MNINFKRIVSFARKRVRNRDKETNILKNLLPEFEIKLNEDGVKNIADIFPQKYESYVLEIGFGSGENIIDLAKNNPANAYIGCEVFTGGVTTLLEEIRDNQISNIKIWHNDALDFIKLIPDYSLNLIYILHPDPWPKRRHNKRRLINADFLRVIAKKMAPNSSLLIITDHQDYAEHIELSVDEVKDIFIRQFDNYPAIVKTKYRLKAEAQGVESKYFGLTMCDRCP